jgi:hypothetical protein
LKKRATATAQKEGKKHRFRYSYSPSLLKILQHFGNFLALGKQTPMPCPLPCVYFYPLVVSPEGCLKKETMVIKRRIPYPIASSALSSSWVLLVGAVPKLQFWNSFHRFNGKTGLRPVFPRACSETNRVLEQAQLLSNCFC